MKFFIISMVLLGSCTVPVQRKKEFPIFKSKETKILECFKFIKRFGSSDSYSGDFCRKVYNSVEM